MGGRTQRYLSRLLLVCLVCGSWSPGTNYDDRIMCHASNTLWALEQVDESLVEKPVAPGGATGGVEFEAMNYVVSLSISLSNCY